MRPAGIRAGRSSGKLVMSYGIPSDRHQILREIIDSAVARLEVPNRTVLLVGNGISRLASGVPSWDGLLSEVWDHDAKWTGNDVR